MVDVLARQNAQAQWTASPCGAVEQTETRLSFFKRVEIERYKQQPWMHDFFHYDRFRGQRVLEIGVGLGTDLMQFADAGAHCHAIDITEEHMNFARENFAVRGKPVDIRRSDATDIEHPDATFDVVYSFGVLHHLPEIDAALAEAYRVLKPGGKALISVYHRWSLFFLGSVLLFNGLLRLKLLTLGYAGLLSTIELGANGTSIAPYVKLYSRKSLAEVMARAGFETKISVRQCSPTDLGRAGYLLPAGLFKLLERRMGWYVIAEAVKPA